MVSVIVPIYNVEKYLLECLDSLNNQSFTDYEVLLIDDGSTDSSSEIAKNYAQNNKKFKYFYKNNGGLSSARNYGIEIANGEWLMFVDSDDVVSNDFISLLYNSVNSSGCKIGVCKFKKFSNKIEFDDNDAKQSIINKEKYLLQMFDSNFMVSCNKIYHKSLFENIKYPFGLIHEDFATTYKLVDLAENIVILNKTLYFYRYNENSITLSKIKNNKIDLLTAYKEQIEYFQKKKEITPYKQIYKKCSNDYFKCFGTLLSYKKARYENFDSFRTTVSQLYKVNVEFIRNLPLSFANKIIFIFSFRNIGLLRFFALIKRKIRYGVEKK